MFLVWHGSELLWAERHTFHVGMSRHSQAPGTREKMKQILSLHRQTRADGTLGGPPHTPSLPLGEENSYCFLSPDSLTEGSIPFKAPKPVGKCYGGLHRKDLELHLKRKNTSLLTPSPLKMTGFKTSSQTPIFGKSPCFFWNRQSSCSAQL